MDKMEDKIVEEVRQYIANNVTLTDYNDEQHKDLITKIVNQKTQNEYFYPKQKKSIENAVFSSIRGLGVLDEILHDETVTEIMINGRENIFIEKSGKLQKLNASFESDKRLEDIIQRIVGTAGREVSLSNPIVDTRIIEDPGVDEFGRPLPKPKNSADGSRVNVVLPPIALTGPTITIRKFSSTPMTIEKPISWNCW